MKNDPQNFFYPSNYVKMPSQQEVAPTDTQNQYYNTQNTQVQQQNNNKNSKIITFAKEVYLRNLSSTRTEYHNYVPDYASNIKAKNYIDVGTYLILLIVFVISDIFFRGTVIFPISLLVIGAVLIILGFKKYTIYNFLANTPITKIHVATYGLYKVKGRFIPYNNQVLISPIGGQRCIYYSVSLWYIYEVRRGSSSSWRIVFLDSLDAGVPALFTDGTGFLAVDLEKAPNVEGRANIIEVIPSDLNLFNFFGMNNKKIANDVMTYIRYAASNNTQANLFNLRNYSFRFQTNKVRDLKSGVSESDLIKSDGIDFGKMFRPNFGSRSYIYLLEQYIPLDEDYIVISGFADTGKTINAKPVKVTVPDTTTGMLALFLEGSDKKYNAINMGGRKMSSTTISFDLFSIFGGGIEGYKKKFLILTALNLLFGVGSLIHGIILLIAFL